MHFASSESDPSEDVAPTVRMLDDGLLATPDFLKFEMCICSSANYRTGEYQLHEYTVLLPILFPVTSRADPVGGNQGEALIQQKYNHHKRLTLRLDAKLKRNRACRQRISPISLPSHRTFLRGRSVVVSELSERPLDGDPGLARCQRTACCCAAKVQANCSVVPAVVRIMLRQMLPHLPIM